MDCVGYIAVPVKMVEETDLLNKRKAWFASLPARVRAYVKRLQAYLNDIDCRPMTRNKINDAVEAFTDGYWRAIDPNFEDSEADEILSKFCLYASISNMKLVWVKDEDEDEDTVSVIGIVGE